MHTYYLPKLGMTEELNEGIDVLDVGCGHGMHVIEFGKNSKSQKLIQRFIFSAQLFPNSRFIGFDVSERAIEHANKRKEEKGLKNVEFVLMDAKEFSPEWTEKFDLIISFDSFHHHNHPERVWRSL